MMNVLFISYWGINEGLSQATVLPHVRLLASFEYIGKVVLCSIERDTFTAPTVTEKVIHVPLVSKNLKNVLLNKLKDYTDFTRKVTEIVIEEDIQLIICRSSLAGGIGYRVSKRTRVPYVVESFEPHASYMLESGVWSKMDPRYWIEMFFQKAQRKTATYLLPVSNSYSQFLVKKGMPREKIIVVPCVVNTSTFFRKKNDLRLTIGIGADVIVGIYVGKFGGLYYETEAFKIFAAARDVFAKFYLLILSPQDKQWIELRIRESGFKDNEFKVIQVGHNEVPDYLSIADLAFATYKPSDSKKYLSPIKIGEYWACGLPVLLTHGVGDDSLVIEQEDCGATFSYERGNVTESLKKIQCQLKDPEKLHRKARYLAMTYRDPEILRKAYVKITQDIPSR